MRDDEDLSRDPDPEDEPDTLAGGEFDAQLSEAQRDADVAVEGDSDEAPGNEPQG